LKETGESRKREGRKKSSQLPGGEKEGGGKEKERERRAAPFSRRHSGYRIHLKNT